jgi:hypothetical protein
VSTGINSLLHKIRQEVLQDGLNILLFDLVDMNTSYTNIEEDMKFSIVLVDKQTLEICCLEKTVIE